MPVGRTEDDGRPFRSYRGKPQPLGSLTEWVCPSCGEKVSGQPFEAGCPHCGVGRPPTPEEIARGVPETHRLAHPQAEGLDDRFHGEHPRYVTSPDPPRRGVEAPALVVTRIIQYICTNAAQQAAMEQTLQRALVGRTGFAWGEIIAAIVDEVSPRQQDILSLARRQPGVWLGGPTVEMRTLRTEHLLTKEEGDRQALAAFDRDRMYAPGTVTGQLLEEAVRRSAGMTESIIPETGPTFTQLDQEMASVIVQACGVKVAYTLVIALQAMDVAADGDPLVLTSQECMALANAILQYIPREYVEPDLPPPPPPNEAKAPVSDEVQAKIAAIQQASKPVPSFRE